MRSSPSRVILASASPARAHLLQEAGIVFVVEPSGIDEAAIKQQHRTSGASAIDCALALASEKARQVSVYHRDVLVIGADQILVVGEDWFDKPVDRAAARLQLQDLRGREHRLSTAVCVMREGALLWHHTDEPRLVMRQFSDSFLDQYMATEGERIADSVGGYRLEGRGVQLFSRIDGSYFSILGLPLLPLLEFLRQAGTLAE